MLRAAFVVQDEGGGLKQQQKQKGKTSSGKQGPGPGRGGEMMCFLPNMFEKKNCEIIFFPPN